MTWPRSTRTPAPGSSKAYGPDRVLTPFDLLRRVLENGAGALLKAETPAPIASPAPAADSAGGAPLELPAPVSDGSSNWGAARGVGRGRRRGDGRGGLGGCGRAPAPSRGRGAAGRRA